MHNEPPKKSPAYFSSSASVELLNRKGGLAHGTSQSLTPPEFRSFDPECGFPILCSTEVSATWCKGGCQKFRYPYSMWCDRPICLDCTLRLGLKPESRKTVILESSATVELPRAHKRTPHLSSIAIKTVSKKPKAKTHVLKVGRRFLSELKNGPRSSVELASALGHTQLWITITGRKLVSSGSILMIREHSTRACCWYALPQHKDLLYKKSGNTDSNLIHATLKSLGPASISDLETRIPDLSRSTIKRRLTSLQKTGVLIAGGSSHLRLYGLPQHYNKIQQLLIEQQPRKKIIDLLRSHPHLWSMEIWRRFHGSVPQKTLLWHLNQLVSFGVLDVVEVKGSRARKLYAVSPNYQFPE